MGFGWDVDDDVFDEDESEDEDEESPYGEDEDLNADDGNPQDGFKDEDDFEAEANAEDDDKGKGKKKKGDAEDVKDLDEKDDGKGKKGEKKKDPWHPDVTKAKAKQNEMPEIVFPVACPICKKKSLYSDKVMPTSIRLTLYIVGSVYGAIPVDKAVTALHLRCMNSKCKSYWKRTGDYFTINPSNPTVPEKHKFIFHVNR